jgi:hypothetical protein
MNIKKIWRENGLSIVLFGLFLLFLVGQSWAGHLEYNNDQIEHGQEAISYFEYLVDPAFISSVFENWESEFLQMGAYVLLTVWLRQKGSAESKKLNHEEAVDADPYKTRSKNSPWPLHVGGLVLKLYSNSLSIALFSLFFISFVLHLIGSAGQFNEQQMAHGQETISLLDHLGNPVFWFESFQNWQSEFLAVWAIVVFSIFLRQKGSPESKPVSAPNDQTGSE